MTVLSTQRCSDFSREMSYLEPIFSYRNPATGRIKKPMLLLGSGEFTSFFF